MQIILKSPKLSLLARYALKRYKNEYAELNKYHVLKEIFSTCIENIDSLDEFCPFILIRMDTTDNYPDYTYKSFAKINNHDELIVIDIKTTEEMKKLLEAEIMKYIRLLNSKYTYSVEYVSGIMFIKYKKQQRDTISVMDLTKLLKYIY